MIAVQEAKDLNVLSLDALIGSLKTHEIKLNKTFEKTNRRGKSIIFKSTHKRSSSFKAMKPLEEEEEPSNDVDDDKKDEIAHLPERISKAWIRRKKKKGFVPKKDKKGKAKQSKIICFECKELGQLRSECLKLKKSSKKKASKKKAMMATWEDHGEKQEGAESQEEKEIVANIYFVADIVFDEETEVMDSEAKFSYDELLDDSQALISHYVSLKKIFQKLSLEFENLKTEKEKLHHEKIELLKETTLLEKDVSALKTEVSEFAQNTSSDVSKLQKIVKLLRSDLEKMVNDPKNLDLMLGSQRPYFDKTGL